MNIALWIVQSLLAFLFLLWGLAIATLPKEKQHGKWTLHFSYGQLRVIGGIQVLGGLGLVLPALTGILPWLTPLAALALTLFMGGAVIVQLLKRWDDSSVIIICTVVLFMALFVAYGRFIVVPLA
jgi:hypothetical protein